MSCGNIYKTVVLKFHIGQTQNFCSWHMSVTSALDLLCSDPDIVGNIGITGGDGNDVKEGILLELMVMLFDTDNFFVVRCHAMK